MGVVYSKLFAKSDFNCYEMAHTWNPSCGTISLELMFDSYRSLLPLYMMLNLATHVMRHKGVPSIPGMFQEILKLSHQSASALALCFFFAAQIFCNSRRLLGYFSPWTWYLGTVIGCVAAIIVERDSRVRLYNVYILQLVLEVLATMAQDCGIEGYSSGNTLLLALSIAAHSYLSKIDGWKPSTLHTWLKLIIGDPGDKKSHKNSPTKNMSLEYILRRAVAVGGCGSLISLLIRIGSSAPKMWKRGVGTVLSNVLSRNTSQSLTLGLALSSFSLAYNGTVYALKSYEQKESDWHCMPASIVAAVSTNYFWPSRRIALYAFCNMLSEAYSVAFAKQAIPSIPLGSRILFGHLCGMLMAIGVLRPDYVRKSYVQFLNGILGNRAFLVNWSAVSHMGFDTAKVYKENLLYPLQFENVSRTYQEKFWVWNLSDFNYK